MRRDPRNRPVNRPVADLLAGCRHRSRRSFVPLQLAFPRFPSCMKSCIRSNSSFTSESLSLGSRGLRAGADELWGGKLRGAILSRAAHSSSCASKSSMPTADARSFGWKPARSQSSSGLHPLNLQEAIDTPAWHTEHSPRSSGRARHDPVFWSPKKPRPFGHRRGTAPTRSSRRNRTRLVGGHLVADAPYVERPFREDTTDVRTDRTRARGLDPPAWRYPMR